MTVPLTVRLTTPDGVQRMVTRQVSGLTFTTKIRGGFASANLTMSRPLDAPPIPALSELAVFDARTGRTVWEGRISGPGRRSGARGQEVQLVAIGEGVASMQDVDTPYMIVDSDLSSWDEQQAARQGLRASVGSLPNSPDRGLVFKSSGTVAAGDLTFAWFRDLALCGQTIGALHFLWRSGETGSHALDIRVGDQPLSVSVTIATYPWNTTAGGALFAFSQADWPATSAPKFVWRMTSSGDVPDTAWSAITAATVYARLLGTDRQPLPNATYQSVPWLTADRVFTDVVARFCPRLDIESAVLEPGSFTFTQLSWPSSITPEKVVDEVLEMEPDFAWAVWEKQPNGRWRTEFKRLESTVRYEATVVDGYDAPAPGSDVYDRAVVRWRDAAGEDQVTVVTNTVPELAAAGMSRTKTLDLGDEVGSAAQAQQYGTAFLADHDVAPNAGTLTIARRLRDLITGRYVDPWEVRSGALVRVRGIQSTPDDLNATSPNGLTVARIVATRFDADEGICEADLDVPALTEQRMIAQLANTRTRG